MSDRIRALRELRGWSQGELAERAGVTRQLVGAVETGRHSPNVAAAIGLSRALDVSVEELFAVDHDRAVDVLGDAVSPGTPMMVARVGDQLISVPVAHGVESSESWRVADAVADETGLTWLPGRMTRGLVVAGCDPVLGMIAGLVERASSHRLVTVHASTGRSVEALAAGRVHGVLVHAPVGGFPEPPVAVRRWHVSSWQVGLASGERSGPPSVAELADRRPLVVQRDAGAGSQRAFVRALQAVGATGSLPGPIGDGHVDVARRVAQHGGSAGVTMEAAARAFGLGFLPLEEHVVEFWLDERWANLPAAVAMIDVLGGTALARRAVVLGGYDIAGCGTERHAS
jgi:DNA-binding XRE family transcriptional regulator